MCITRGNDTFVEGSGSYVGKGKIYRRNFPLASCTMTHTQNSIRDAPTPQTGEIVFNTMRYRISETVHRLGYFQSSVSVQIMFK